MAKLAAGGAEEEYVGVHWVFVEVTQTEHTTADRRCWSRLVVRATERAKTKDTQLEAEEVFSAMPPSEGLETQTSSSTTDGGNEQP